ncbi:MAG TPA: hypothetical protein VLD59_16345 [Steroidobacteraceae bacterium]|nr:hypothetical protein [Steroidobacteraceae bacterium]
MSKPIRWQCLFLAGTIGATAVDVRLVGQELTNVGIVQRLMRAAYPELEGQQLKVLVNVDTEYDSDWRRFGIVGVSVTRGGEKLEPTLEGQANQFLGGFFILQPQEGYIQSAVFNGQHVNTRVMRDIADALEAHPEWSDEDVLSALKRADARYGPDRRAEFLQQLKIERFVPVFGTVLNVQQQFEWQPSKNPVARDAVPPRWTVSLQVLDIRQRRMCYNLTFEPIAGRLMSFRGERCE